MRKQIAYTDVGIHAISRGDLSYQAPEMRRGRHTSLEDTPSATVEPLKLTLFS